MTALVYMILVKLVSEVRYFPNVEHSQFAELFIELFANYSSRLIYAWLLTTDGKCWVVSNADCSHLHSSLEIRKYACRSFISTYNCNNKIHLGKHMFDTVY